MRPVIQVDDVACYLNHRGERLRSHSDIDPSRYHNEIDKHVVRGAGCDE